MGDGLKAPSAAVSIYSEVRFVLYSFSIGIYFASLTSMDLQSLIFYLA